MVGSQCAIWWGDRVEVMNEVIAQLAYGSVRQRGQRHATLLLWRAERAKGQEKEGFVDR